MADTSAATGLTVQQWDEKFDTEYFQENRFKGEMGTSENSIIQVKEDLAKDQGDSLTFALANGMTGAGKTGNQTMEGAEEAIVSRSMKLTVIQRRNAFRIPMSESQFSSINLRQAGRSVLKDWADENSRDQIIAQLGSINGELYADADATARNAWLVDNSDRFLAGALKANNAANVHADALAEVDATADKITPGLISLMKRIALAASPAIRPVRSLSSGRRYYVLYAPSLIFRDLSINSTMVQAQRDVSLRMANERLFQGGDLYWDGVVIKEIDDIPVYLTGASSAQIAPAYLCGAGAIGYGRVSTWNTVEEEFDYKDKYGLCIREFGNFAKLRFGTETGVDTGDTKDHGIVTGWFSAAADG
jgi:hypothetical protein